VQLEERISVLRRAGLDDAAIAAILDTDREEVHAQVVDVQRADPPVVTPARLNELEARLSTTIDERVAAAAGVAPTVVAELEQRVAAVESVPTAVSALDERLTAVEAVPTAVTQLQARVEAVEGAAASGGGAAELVPRIKLTEARLNIPSTDGEWIEPALLGSWGTSVEALLAGHKRFGYRLDPATGVVYLRGRLTQGWGSTNGNQIATLPYRPANDIFVWRQPPNNAQYNDTSLYVRQDGKVDVNPGNSNSTWIDFNGVAFQKVN
jgi:hypothetical protein